MIGLVSGYYRFSYTDCAKEQYSFKLHYLSVLRGTTKMFFVHLFCTPRGTGLCKRSTDMYRIFKVLFCKFSQLHVVVSYMHDCI